MLNLSDYSVVYIRVIKAIRESVINNIDIEVKTSF